MSWVSIILWLITNWPELMKLLGILFGRKTMTPVAKENLRMELSIVISDPRLSRKEKKAKVREILERQ